MNRQERSEEARQNSAITGLGRFGGSIRQTLVEAGQEVLTIDGNEGRVNEYMNAATHAAVANARDEMTLRSLGIRSLDHVVVVVGEDIQASILVTLTVKEMGVPNVLAKAANKYHVRVLDKIGVDMVAYPKWDMGIRIAHKLVSCNILDYIELSNEFSLAEVRVANPEFYNRALVELNLRRRFGLTVVAIRRLKTEVIASPDASEIVWENDNLLVIGDTVDVNSLNEKMNG